MHMRGTREKPSALVPKSPLVTQYCACSRTNHVHWSCLTQLSIGGKFPQSMLLSSTQPSTSLAVTLSRSQPCLALACPAFVMPQPCLASHALGFPTLIMSQPHLTSLSHATAKVFFYLNLTLTKSLVLDQVHNVKPYPSPSDLNYPLRDQTFCFQMQQDLHSTPTHH